MSALSLAVTPLSVDSRDTMSEHCKLALTDRNMPNRSH